MDETERPNEPAEPRDAEASAKAAESQSPEVSPAPAIQAAGPEEPIQDVPGAEPAVSDAAAVEETPAKTEASAAKPPTPVRRRVSLGERLADPAESSVGLPASAVRARTRRDFLFLTAGALAAAGGFWWLLPDETRQHHLTPGMRDWLDSLEARVGADRARRERFLNRVLTFDDDVAEALYSPTRSVRTYSKFEITPLKNNYNGATPKPDYVPGWALTVSGLASNRVERFTISDLLRRFARYDQVTRICCVEGWSAVAWWGGLRFADFLAAYPPAPGARWAKLESSVNLDSAGDSDPYYVSIDLPTAHHPQTLLATHLSGRPLPVEHGAPLRLLSPMKLGLKNIKAITSIAYSVEEPADYWNERGYSRYDGL
jgi:DMSO/TMAO reductase YedYZ molybdopterin-dependent catalytic subunit